MKRENWQVRTVLVLIAIMLGAWAVTGLVIKPKIGIMGTEAAELPKIEQDSPWRVKVEFAGLETVSGEGLAWDSLELEVESSEGQMLNFYDEPVLADYWFLGKWRQVLDSRQTYNIYHSAAGYEGPRENKLRFPAGTFGRFGLYRVRLVKTGWKTKEAREAGSCAFLVTKPTKKVEGMLDNDFESWYKLDGDDYINEHISLKFMGSYIYKDARPHLVFGLTCDREGYSRGALMRVDRLWQGEWYAVSGMGAVRGYAMCGEVVPGEEQVMTREIPPQVLRHKGKYRLYWGGAAYCEFTVS